MRYHVALVDFLLDGRRAASGAHAARRDPCERRRAKDRVRQRLARASRRLARAMTDKPWLRAYPPGVPAEIDPDRYASLCDLLDASFARYAAAPAFSNLGTDAELRRGRSAEPRVRRVPAVASGRREGRAHRGHAAEHVAVAGGALRRAARRARRRERESAVHDAGARASARGQRRARDRRAREFRGYRASTRCRTRRCDT